MLLVPLYCLCRHLNGRWVIVSGLRQNNRQFTEHEARSSTGCTLTLSGSCRWDPGRPSWQLRHEPAPLRGGARSLRQGRTVLFATCDVETGDGRVVAGGRRSGGGASVVGDGARPVHWAAPW